MTEQQFKEFSDTIVAEGSASGLLHANDEPRLKDAATYVRGFCKGAVWVLIRLHSVLQIYHLQKAGKKLIKRYSAYSNVKQRVSQCEVVYTAIDHTDTGQSLPEENETVSWWYRGDGCAPYIGTLLDDDFPGKKEFFCWSTLPEPPSDFFNEHNK